LTKSSTSSTTNSVWPLRPHRRPIPLHRYRSFKRVQPTSGSGGSRPWPRNLACHVRRLRDRRQLPRWSPHHRVFPSPIPIHSRSCASPACSQPSWRSPIISAPLGEARGRRPRYINVLLKNTLDRRTVITSCGVFRDAPTNRELEGAACAPR